MNKIYFPSLNGIRCIAALLVFVHHFEQITKMTEAFNLTNFTFFSQAGSIGVTLFFVLSGFLITYLLLEELKINKDIDIKAFYVRRIIRIWPLYFLTLILALSIAHFQNDLTANFFMNKLFMYIFFMANMANILYASGGFPSQLWSVASEEQFYLVWPWVVKKLKGKILPTIYGIVILYVVLRLVLKHATIPGTMMGMNLGQFILKYINLFRIDCMAIGALGAYIVYYKRPILKWIYSLRMQLVIIAGVICLLSFSILSGVFGHIFHAIFFVLLIINLATNKQSILNLENPFFDYLGKISYGLYVYHPMVLIFLWKIVGKYSLNTAAFYLLYYFLLSLAATIAVASVSYYYIEKPILKLKRKYSTILTGDDVKSPSIAV